MFPSAPRNSPPELSDSLFNNPRRVNNPVSFRPREELLANRASENVPLAGMELRPETAGGRSAPAAPNRRLSIRAPNARENGTRVRQSEGKRPPRHRVHSLRCGAATCARSSDTPDAL